MQLLLNPSRGLRFRQVIVKMSDILFGNHVMKIYIDVKSHFLFDISFLQHLMKYPSCVLLSVTAVPHLQEITLPVHFPLYFTKREPVQHIT